MGFLKLGFISIIILFLVATCIGLLLPSKVIVSRVTDIFAPKDSIYARVKNINQWKLWVAGMSNENVQIISPTIAILNGTKVSITSIDNYTIQSLWTGKKNTVQQSRLIIIQDNTTNKAIVQWQFVEQLKWYPWQRLGSMMNEAVMGSQLETNLANLKKICEPQ